MLGTDLIKGAKGVEADTNGVITARQVYHMVENGSLPVIRMGRAMYFRRSELDAAFSSGLGQWIVLRPRGKVRNKPNATGRNEAKDRFARLPHSILVSEAYRSLDPVARCLLVEIAMIENGRNNGSIFLSTKDATDRLGLADQRPAMRGFDDLQDRGLIAKTKEAHFEIKTAETSRARCWRITWQAYDNKGPSNEWQSYIAPPKSKARRAADRGLRAMARFRNALAAMKFPVVNFTVITQKTPEI